VTAVLEVLRAELGPEAVHEGSERGPSGSEADGEPAETAAFRDDGGGMPGAWVRPADGESLAAALRALDEAGGAALVRGGGTRLALGNPPRRTDCVLSTERLARVRELDAEEGVCLTESGVPLAGLAAQAADAGWELPLEAPEAGATVGGALACAAVGPRVACFGPARDHLLGLQVALAGGERTRCGGRVVKNVTGYDLMRLHTGALGTLGVLEAAWLRLRPRPEAVEAHRLWVRDPEAGLARAAALRDAAALRVLALVDPALAGQVDPSGPQKGQWLLLAELGGSGPERERARQRLGGADLDAAEPAPAAEGAVARLARLQGGPEPASGLRFRVAVPPARVGRALEAFSRAGASVLAYPSVGLVYARFPLFADAGVATVDAAWRAAREAARKGAGPGPGAGGGHVLLESAPVWAKAVRDVFGDAEAALPLYRAVKERFDPRGVLNPGRFAGGL